MTEERRERQREATRRWRAKNPDYAKISSRAWREKNRSHYLEYAHKYLEENRERAYASNRSRYRTERFGEWRKRYMSKNRERLRALHRRWREANRGRLNEWHRGRRQKASSHWLSKNQWEPLLDKYGHRCLCCGTHESDAGHGLVADHIIPVCMEGPNMVENAQPLCFDCNRRKNRRAIDYRPMFLARFGTVEP